MRSLGIWLCEMLGEAVGTVACITFLAALEYKPAFPGDIHPLRELVDLTALKQYLGAGIFVPIEFGMTGYLLATAVAAWYLRTRKPFVYPWISSILYIVHSEIFFLAAGWRLSDPHNLPLQIGGTLVTFGMT